MWQDIANMPQRKFCLVRQSLYIAKRRSDSKHNQYVHDKIIIGHRLGNKITGIGMEHGVTTLNIKNYHSFMEIPE